jgi:NADH:ubiquinone oxidoreductase subunit
MNERRNKDCGRRYRIVIDSSICRIAEIECSYDSIVDYTIDEKTTDIKLIAKSALPKYEKDEKKQYAVSGLIQAYFFQLMDLVEEYYEFLDVKEIEREI